MDASLELVAMERKALPSLRSSTSWTLAASVVYAAAQWAMISAVAKLTSAATVGQFALGLSIAAPVFMLTNMQLRGVQVTDALSEHTFADYFTLRCLSTIVGALLILAIVILARYDLTTASVILLVAVAKAVEQLSDVVAGWLQKCERLDLAARAQMLRGAGSAIVFTLVLVATHSLVAALYGVAAVCVLVLLFCDRRFARRLHGGSFLNSTGRGLKSLVGVTLPLGLVTALAALNVNVPRYVVQYYLGPAQLGIFVSLAYVLVATVNVIVNAMGQSASARLAQMFAAGDLAGFNAVLRNLVLFGAAITMLGTPAALVCGRPLLTLIYRPDYAQYSSLLAIMVAVAGISAIGLVLGFGVTATRRFRSQMPVIGAAALAAFAVAALTVPGHGLFGAAFALLASATVSIIGNGAILLEAERRMRTLCDVVPCGSSMQASREAALAVAIAERD